MGPTHELLSCMTDAHVFLTSIIPCAIKSVGGEIFLKKVLLAGARVVLFPVRTGPVLEFFGSCPGTHPPW